MARSAYSRIDYEGAALATTISSGINASVLSISITASTGWPDGSAGTYFVVVDEGTSSEEKIQVSSRSGTTLTVPASGRGADGTSAATHASGASIRPCFTATEADEANYWVAELSSAATATGKVLVADGTNSLGGISAGTSGQILVGNGTTLASVPLSGDATLSSAGALTITETELAALKGVTSAADKVPYFTGSGTATVADFTAAGRALIDDADAAAQRTTLGLGTVATQAASGVAITGGTITGITDLAVADGGTAASTAAAARTNLGISYPVFIDFARAGDLTTGTGTARWRAPVAMTLQHTRLKVATSPSGASILVDVNINGTTAYTTQANRPTILSGLAQEDAITAPDVTAVAAGSWLTVDIDQVGSTTPGADLVVVVYALVAG